MKRNRVISAAKDVSTILIFISIIIYLLFLIAIIHWHFDPSFYNNFNVTEYLEPPKGLKIIYFNIHEYEINLSNVSYGMVYWFAIKFTIICFLYIAILRKGLKILNSIKSLNIFYSENVKNFRTIGKYALIIFSINSIYFYIGNEYKSYGIVLSLEILLLSLASFIIAEIFAEGKLLQEEKEQII